MTGPDPAASQAIPPLKAHPGSFCPKGAEGVFASGTRAECSAKEGHTRARWRRHRDAPSPAKKSSPVQATSAPAPQIDDVEQAIRAAYNTLAPHPGAYCGLAQLRDELMNMRARRGMALPFPTSEVDAALRRMYAIDGVSIIPNSQQGDLTDLDRSAAVQIGGQWKHLISIDETSPAEKTYDAAMAEVDPPRKQRWRDFYQLEKDIHWSTTAGQGAASGAHHWYMIGEPAWDIADSLHRQADQLERRGEAGNLSDYDMTGTLRHDQATRDRAASHDANRLRALADKLEEMAGPRPSHGELIEARRRNLQDRVRLQQLAADNPRYADERARRLEGVDELKEDLARLGPAPARTVKQIAKGLSGPALESFGEMLSAISHVSKVGQAQAILTELDSGYGVQEGLSAEAIEALKKAARGAIGDLRYLSQ